MPETSEISGFYKLSLRERLELVKKFASLEDGEAQSIGNFGAIEPALVNRMIENVVGTMPLPLGIAVNFFINGKDYLIPMAIEETSVVAAASNAAKMARPGGGFTAGASPPLMIGQIQLTKVPDPNDAKLTILSKKDEIIRMANEKDPLLIKVGGGARDLEVRVIDTLRGKMVIVHLIVDCRDAAGMNAVITMSEAVAPFIEEITGGRVFLRIISNLAIYRLVKARATFQKNVIGGDEVVEAILEAHAFASADPFRCATHNKGIMNGIDAVVIATGNDFRAIEAGAHSYAATKVPGKYSPLTDWEKNANGDLVGTIELPMAVGLIGGMTAVHPTAKANVKILGVKSAAQLAEVTASVGLAQNFAALRALATEGIARGHMSLHARNIAVMAGASMDEVDEVVRIMVKEKKVRMDRAKDILDELRREK